MIPDPVIEYVSPNSEGTITFTPELDEFGSATIIIRIEDDGEAPNNFVEESFV